MQASTDQIRVEIVYAEPEEQLVLTLDVPRASTVGDAIRRSGILERRPGIDLRRVGIYGRRVTLSHTLQPDDRIEIYRQLKVEPKKARRSRASALSKH
ncbi:MAG: RnfH family protein [Gammaproteobacteria bacterium]|nr:RnfH family protein [Gammaproteobacteria bacterium]